MPCSALAVVSCSGGRWLDAEGGVEGASVLRLSLFAMPFRGRAGQGGSVPLMPAQEFRQCMTVLERLPTIYRVGTAGSSPRDRDFRMRPVSAPSRIMKERSRRTSWA